MATTTTNFGWDIPQSTDLVKDGATAIAALGQDIDTALIDLKGGTTGQVLAKASGTDLDFTFTTIASGSMTVLASGSLSGSTLSLTSISGSYKDLKLVLRDFYTSTATPPILRFNSDASSLYSDMSINRIGGSNTFVGYNVAELNPINQGMTNSDNNNALIVDVLDYANTNAFKMCQAFAITDSSSSRGTTLNQMFGTYRSTSAITAISLPLTSGSYSGGTYILYGVN